MYHREVLPALPLAVGMLVAHEEVAAETLERPHLPVGGHEVEGIAVTVRRGGRTAHRLVQLRAAVAGGDVDALCCCRRGEVTFIIIVHTL